MNRSILFFSFLCFCLYPADVYAELSSFVADAVQAAPGKEARRGKLYVSQRGTRFEFTAQKQKVIQIIQPSRGLFWLLFPKTKTYFEIKTAPSGLIKSSHAKMPCRPAAQTICRKRGIVKSGKAVLEHWVVGGKGAKQQINVWWDPVRHMYIKQVFPDGRTMLAEMTGSIEFEGRLVEQWRMSVPLKGKAWNYSYMLFAPDLGFPVMEQGSKGLIKELHNIKPYNADSSLFEIPSGYKKVLPPKIPRR